VVARLPRAWWLVLLVAGLAIFYLEALRTGFLNDDYLFLEQAKRAPLTQSVATPDALGNFYRPLSRQIYFFILTPLAGDRPLVFHLVNFAIFAGSLVLLADLLLAMLPLPSVLAGTLYFAVIPFQRVNLIWVSCSQDLLALFFSLGSIAFYRRRKTSLAALAYALAIFSKESALPLPLALAAWTSWIEPAASRDRAETRGRLLPFVIVAAIWGTVRWWAGPRVSTAPLGFGPEHFAAGYVHGLQSLLGLDHPAGFIRGLLHPGSSTWVLVTLVPALLLLAPAALALRGATAEGARDRRSVLLFAAAWLVAFGIVTGPVAAIWSSYYYTLFGVGGAMLVGLACSRIRPADWLVLCAGLLWWHAGGTSFRAFAVAERPWVWTSHLTSFYFQRGAALTDTLARQMRRIEPKPEPGTRFFFSQLPSWAGFQSGNGALIRSIYRDPSIASYFYTQFSESTAAARPCRFLYWDGRELAPLYPSDPRRFLQVGADLLAMDRLEGARHAFRRSLEAGESQAASLYWLGWTELWLLRRGAAEAAWKQFGARDDTTTWMLEMRRARQALNDNRDTLAARRALAAAIRSGIGLPEAHAVLGQLLLRDDPKFAILELKVAAFLKPDDWVTRRDLAIGFYRSGQDDDARLQMAQLAVLGFDWRTDSLLVAAARTMERRSMSGISVAEFGEE